MPSFRRPSFALSLSSNLRSNARPSASDRSRLGMKCRLVLRRFASSYDDSSHLDLSPRPPTDQSLGEALMSTYPPLLFFLLRPWPGRGQSGGLPHPRCAIHIARTARIVRATAGRPPSRFSAAFGNMRQFWSVLNACPPYVLSPN